MDGAAEAAAAQAVPGGGFFLMLKKIKSRIIEAVAVCSVICNIVAIALGRDLIFFIAGGAAVLVGPLVIYQEEKLEDLDSLRTVQNDIRNNANELAQENKKLGQRTGALKDQMDELSGTQEELTKFAEEYGSDVDTLVGLVAEHKKLVEQTTKIIEDDIYNDVVKVVVRGDRNRDGVLDDREIRSIIRRLSMDERYKINQDLLRKKVKAEPSLKGVLSLVKDLRRTDIPEEQRVFVLTD